MGNESIEPLPEAPPNLAGERTDSGSRYNITVSNASGYLCHIHMQVWAPCLAYWLRACMHCLLDILDRCGTLCVCSPTSAAIREPSSASSPTQVCAASSRR